jgi:hypothetical protein
LPSVAYAYGIKGDIMRLLVLICALLLSACGGGDPEDQPDQQINPPACKESPALCQ